MGRFACQIPSVGRRKLGSGRSLVTRQEELVQRVDFYLSSRQKTASELPSSNSVLVLQEQFGLAKKNFDEVVAHNKLMAERLSEM